LRHNQVREFKCDCGKDFVTNYDLTRHQKTHKEDRPFPCDECKKSFKTNCSLNTHKKTHNKTRGGTRRTIRKSFFR
jgi:KRAB domain-containing zinc finger protein